jgi:hypothetical protein
MAKSWVKLGWSSGSLGNPGGTAMSEPPSPIGSAPSSTTLPVFIVHLSACWQSVALDRFHGTHCFWWWCVTRWQGSTSRSDAPPQWWSTTLERCYYNTTPKSHVTKSTMADKASVMTVTPWSETVATTSPWFNSHGSFAMDHRRPVASSSTTGKLALPPGTHCGWQESFRMEVMGQGETYRLLNWAFCSRNRGHYLAGASLACSLGLRGGGPPPSGANTGAVRGCQTPEEDAQGGRDGGHREATLITAVWHCGLSVAEATLWNNMLGMCSPTAWGWSM